MADTTPTSQIGFEVARLKEILHLATTDVKTHLEKIQSKKQDEINIADMFEMQLRMNHLSQLSEMTTNVISASHQAIRGMTQNIKG